MDKAIAFTVVVGLGIALQPAGAIQPAMSPSVDSPREDNADHAAFNTVCGACHSSSSVNGLRTEAEWKETLEHMIAIGAKGTDEQFESVMRVLLRTLTKVNVNTATAGEIAPVLDISNTAAQAMIKYRVEHGNFKAINDLKKVPGLDAGKIDSRKERLIF
jgi:competence protein ComEA